jgi:hypothetical protein
VHVAGSTAVADTAGENSLYQMIAGLPNGDDINAEGEGDDKNTMLAHAFSNRRMPRTL